MKLHCASSGALVPACRAGGFTLIELMIAVAIIAILARIALPAYFDTIRKGRRSDAVAAVAQAQQAQERYRANNSTYVTYFIVSSGNLTGVGVSTDTSAASTYTTPNGYYQLSITSAGTTSYTIRAAAQGTQANDTKCKYMDLVVSAGNLSYNSGTTTSTSADNGTCWKR
jgi:type IV pilus assembly protein PilE